MLRDNQRALNLTTSMGFQLQYSDDGTVRGALNLKEETTNEVCKKQQETPDKTIKEEKTTIQQNKEFSARKAETSSA
jgi:hypothetical protein